jgi:hypothetical protein
MHLNLGLLWKNFKACRFITISVSDKRQTYAGNIKLNRHGNVDNIISKQ